MKYNCSTEFVHEWTGSAFTGQCPHVDSIPLATSGHIENDTFICGVFTSTIKDVDLPTITSELSFTATAMLNGTEVICKNGSLDTVVQHMIDIKGECSHKLAYSMKDLPPYSILMTL